MERTVRENTRSADFDEIGGGWEIMRHYTIKVMCMGSVEHDDIRVFGENAFEAFENSNIYLPLGAAYEGVSGIWC